MSLILLLVIPGCMEGQHCHGWRYEAAVQVPGATEAAIEADLSVTPTNWSQRLIGQDVIGVPRGEHAGVLVWGVDWAPQDMDPTEYGIHVRAQTEPIVAYDLEGNRFEEHRRLRYQITLPTGTSEAEYRTAIRSFLEAATSLNDTQRESIATNNFSVYSGTQWKSGDREGTETPYTRASAEWDGFDVAHALDMQVRPADTSVQGMLRFGDLRFRIATELWHASAAHSTGWDRDAWARYQVDAYDHVRLDVQSAHGFERHEADATARAVLDDAALTREQQRLVLDAAMYAAGECHWALD